MQYAFLIPRVDECLNALEGAKLFSSLNLASDYNKVASKPEDKEETALTDCNRMPFMLANSVSAFQLLVPPSRNDYMFKCFLSI